MTRIYNLLWQFFFVVMFIGMALIPATMLYCFVKIAWICLCWIARHLW